MSSYYENYGDDINDIVSAIDNANSSMQDTAALWASYSGARADRELRKYLFEKQLEWNSPSAQRQRLEEAGYNPFMGRAVTAGNMDSIPDLGQDPLSSAAGSLSQMADNTLKRLSSRIAVQEAKLRLAQVNSEYEKLLMQKDLFPIQRKIAQSQADNLALTTEFLNGSLQARIDDAIQMQKLHANEATFKSYYNNWMGENGNFYDYYDEVYNLMKTRNSYTNFLMQHAKDRDKIEDEHWDIINNPFGLDVGTGTVNSALNFLFQLVRLIFNR